MPIVRLFVPSVLYSDMSLATQEQEMALGKLSKTGTRKQDEKVNATVSVELETPSSKNKHLRVSYLGT